MTLKLMWCTLELKIDDTLVPNIELKNKKIILLLKHYFFWVFNTRGETDEHKRNFL